MRCLQCFRGREYVPTVNWVRWEGWGEELVRRWNCRIRDGLINLAEFEMGLWGYKEYDGGDAEFVANDCFHLSHLCQDLQPANDCLKV